MVPLKRNLYGHRLGGLLGERQFDKILLESGYEKAPTREGLFVHRPHGLSLSVYMDDIKKGMQEAQSGTHVEEIDERH